MASMMKSFGLDPEEIKANIDGFMLHMKAQGEKVEANQIRIEQKLDAHTELLAILVDQKTGTSTAILENGVDTGTFVTSEKFPQRMIDDVNNTGA